MADESNPSGLLPFVRHMLICEHAEPSRTNPRRANILGVFANIVFRGEATSFPSRLGFSVYAMLTECRRDGIGRILVTEADSEEVCYVGIPHRVRFSADPLEVHGLIFRIPECTVPRPGLYWIELQFDGARIAEEAVLIAVR